MAAGHLPAGVLAVALKHSLSRCIAPAQKSPISAASLIVLHHQPSFGSS